MNGMKLYLESMRTAWMVTWKHKALWICGLFLFWWAAKGIENELNSLRVVTEGTNPLSPLWWQMDMHGAIQYWTSVFAIPAWALAIIVGVAGLVVAAMISITYAAIVHATDLNETTDTQSYALLHAWQMGKQVGLPVAGIYFGLRVIQYICVLAVVWPWFGSGTTVNSFEVWWMAIGGLLMWPLLILINFWMRWSINAAVIDRLHAIAALRRGWGVVRSHWIVSIEVAVVVFLAFIGMLVATEIITTIVTLPLFTLSSVSSLNGIAGVSWLQMYDMIFSVLLVCLIVFGSVLFSIWHLSTWAVLYRAWKHQPDTMQSVIVRWIRVRL